METARSALAVAVAEAWALLLAATGSAVALVTDAASVRVVPAAPEGTATTTTKVALWPEARVVIVSVSWPPGAASVEAGPAVGVWDTRVVPAGRVAPRDTVRASLGHLLGDVTVEDALG